MGEAQKMAEAGMALFAKEGTEDVEVDTAAAAVFKTEHERAIEEKSELEKTLTGKDNKKQRTAVAKEIKELKNDAKYIDACKIAKGMDPPKGNFIVKKSAPAAAAAAEPAAPAAEPAAPAAEAKSKAKDDKKPKKAESAGISKAERDELVVETTDHKKEGRTQGAGPIWRPEQQGSRSRRHGRAHAGAQDQGGPHSS
jgi:hypothetical protein